MIIYKLNKYNNRYYQYDLDDYDYMSPMFDEDLHNNDLTPTFVKKTTVCAYCHTAFSSRNKLFYHLGFHNIDICKPKQEDTGNHEDCMMGDYGVIFNKEKRFKSLFGIRKVKKRKKKDISDLLQDMYLK